jgi:hypothetical protein
VSLPQQAGANLLALVVELPAALPPAEAGGVRFTLDATGRLLGLDRHVGDRRARPAVLAPVELRSPTDRDAADAPSVVVEVGGEGLAGGSRWAVTPAAGLAGVSRRELGDAAAPGRLELRSDGEDLTLVSTRPGTLWTARGAPITVEPGELELPKAPKWKLFADARSHALYKKRAAHIAEGRSPATDAANARAAAAAKAVVAAKAAAIAIAAADSKAAADASAKAAANAQAKAAAAATAAARPPLGSGVRVAVGAGAGLGSRLTPAGAAGAVEAGPRLGIEAGYEAAIGGTPVALRIGGQYDAIPVPACGTEQASAMFGGLHFGPRLAMAVTDGAWITGTFGLRVGGGKAVIDDAVRAGCSQGVLDGGAEDSWAVPVTGDDGETGVVSLGELGWRGSLLGLGPFAEVGLMAAPTATGPRIGFGVQFGYDRLLPILPEAREVRFRKDGGGIGKLSVGTVASNASFGRFTVAVRGVVLLP